MSADTAVRRARQAVAAGDWDLARQTIEAELRSGQWQRAALWGQLLSLMAGPEDYPRLRTLWLASPRACHDTVGIIRVVARAASVAGEHDEARALLRKAIVLRSRPRPRARARLGRLKRSVLARLPRHGASAVEHRNLFAQRASVALAELDRELSATGTRTFLISGTLLGLVREAGFIGWDKDIDVGYFTEEIDAATLEQVFRRSTAFQVRRLDFNTDRLRVDHTNGVKIDIFPHYPGEDGRIWHDGTATRWWNTPFGLQTVDFLGRPQLVPDPPERYLDENYGDWRTPRPHFDARLDTPNVEVTDPAYLHTLLFFSLLDAIGNGNRHRRQRYRDLLAAGGEGAWLGRVT